MKSNELLFLLLVGRNAILKNYPSGVFSYCKGKFHFVQTIYKLPQNENGIEIKDTIKLKALLSINDTMCEINDELVKLGQWEFPYIEKEFKKNLPYIDDVSESITITKDLKVLGEFGFDEFIEAYENNIGFRFVRNQFSIIIKK